jgi:corrinoid protein of di/trimethylamine methyltransferase
MARCVRDMEDEEVTEVTQEYADAGYDPQEGIMNGLVVGMNEAGKLYEEEEYYIPELLICSDAMYNGLDVLRPLLPQDAGGNGTKVVIAVIQGDTHDIGKNLVKIMLEAAGYQVVDLGRDVPIARLVDAVREEKPQILALSTLMSTSMAHMGTLIEELKKAGLRDSVQVIVGGAPLSRGFAEKIGADGFAEGVASFGIGQLTGIDYPGEVTGIVKTRGEYDGSSVGSMSFGQGLAIPLVQMVRAIGSVANGGMLLTPHFVTTVGGEPSQWPDPQRAISRDTAEKVTDMMRTVVEDGTGFSAQVDGFDVAAKTGTGEQAKDGKYIKGKFLSSLIGFAPASDPQVMLYVGLNETPYISYSSAGPVFSAIMSEVLADMGVLSPQGL